MQISKLNPKMGYFGGPNKALINMGFKRPNWSHLGRANREGKTRREEEEEEEKKKKKKRGSSQKGMDAWILVWNYMVLYGFLV